MWMTIIRASSSSSSSSSSSGIRQSEKEGWERCPLISVAIYSGFVLPRGCKFVRAHLWMWVQHVLDCIIWTQGKLVSTLTVYWSDLWNATVKFSRCARRLMYGNMEPHCVCVCFSISLSTFLSLYPNDKTGTDKQQVSLLPPEDPVVRFQIWLRKEQEALSKAWGTTTTTKKNLSCTKGLLRGRRSSHLKRRPLHLFSLFVVIPHNWSSNCIPSFFFPVWEIE